MKQYRVVDFYDSYPYGRGMKHRSKTAEDHLEEFLNKLPDNATIVSIYEREESVHVVYSVEVGQPGLMMGET